MATYTLEEFDDVLDRFAEGMPTAIAKGVFLAAQKVRGDLPGRIFNKGKAVDGSDIGQYSTSPTLVGAKSFATKTAANKVFGSKKKRKELEWVRIGKSNLAVMEGGYKQIREISNRRSDKVDLNFKRDLQRSIKLLKVGDTWQLKIFGGNNAIKARANEKRFKGAKDTIFAPSKKEDEAANRAFNAEISKYIKSFFSG